MTPPPAEDERNASGSASISTSQSITCVSISVQAGLVAQSIPCTPRPAESSSPRMLGYELLLGKKAKKLGDCQCVMPGIMMSSTSRMILSNGSPDCGGEDGSF